MLNRTASPNPLSSAFRVVQKAALGISALAVAASITAGCLQRPVKKQDPQTNNVYVDQIKQTAVDKIDLLFMIDNSVSMADKQTILGKAVPILLSRLITPDCVDEGTGMKVGTLEGGVCAMGAPEFSPIKDIHIGVVSSSLGSNGGQVCAVTSDSQANGDTPDDRGELLGEVRGLTSYNNTGFLAWDPDTDRPRNSPPGETDRGTLITNFTQHVLSASEFGCGFESSLEAWYRFLIDPSPPNQVVLESGASTKQGVNNTVLTQRAAFMRPDSLLAIVMLSDENDCSIIDQGQGWLVGYTGSTKAPFHMPRATSTCATDPNSPCCRSCGTKEAAPPDASCGALGEDPECLTGGGSAEDPGAAKLSALEDATNLRCYNQKRRFGFDLLHDVSRYVEGLTSPLIYDWVTGTKLPNPIYTGVGDKPARDTGLVFLAGIIGVPWQDLAAEQYWDDPDNLTYLTASELEQQGRWDVILGDPTGGVLPTDPLMIETVDPRSGTHPLLTNVVIAPATSTNPQENIINGHEQNLPGRNDLQYACIFPLLDDDGAPAPKDCTDPEFSKRCDCSSIEKPTETNRPLCQAPAGGGTRCEDDAATCDAGQDQYYAKAYPGVRELQVLKGFGPNAIVASICPKVLDADTPAREASYGYNPAVAAIITRLKEALNGKCLPRALAVDTNATLPDGNTPNPNFGQVPCQVVEALPNAAESCDCTVDGRADVDPEIVPAVIEQLTNTAQCDAGEGSPECASFCLCTINQFTGADLAKCRNDVNYSGAAGYCYIDQGLIDQEQANGAIIEKCPDTQKRLLRFVPQDTTPRANAVTFIACVGSDVNASTDEMAAAE